MVLITASSATNYFNNIPNMSLYEITNDLGFAVVQIVEGTLFSKGVGLAGKSLGTVTKIGRVAKTGGNLIDDVAKQAKSWLGRDYKVVTNKAGDNIFMSKDGLRKMRFDIKNLMEINHTFI